MGNPVVTSAFVRLMDERLREVKEDTLKGLPGMIDTLYNVMDSQSAWEEYMRVGNVPDIPEFNGKISYLPIYAGYTHKIEHKEYAGGVQFQRKLLDDKKYSVFDQRAAKLVKAMHRTKEKKGVRAFAYSDSGAFDYMTSEENLSLANSSHTTKAGTSTASGFDNAGSSALSKTAVGATRILMRQFRDDISERIDMSDNMALVVPSNLADLAEEITRTPSGYDTAGKDYNPQGNGRFRVIEYPRLDDYDSTNWHMVNMDLMKENLIWFDRIKDDTNFTMDFETYMSKYSIYGRWSYGWIDWRWIYTHVVT